ncbi:16S rRNA (uracil(1498)-N(3))-methyltransferase [Spiribacter vilamensis]|uniref:Ribosomal RNA small subunit methyltransferase E n=1 Tax=Spiribacter vilamensis TaxID=531306 RepID=A0A4Q8D1Q0_9GAMM|nr:16S rRNA (uracil(1498)-N(3))-methyltransferase [Spiribacter vilamensis]RZU99190.1 16S rRNA m(3)U-1498 methyltransferase [Spiribacter vilamensis]TVO61822.1 16S rRNA (uracil(1498)-N(3))-methyltransferase [Spiribacter vilamensis]
MDRSSPSTIATEPSTRLHVTGIPPVGEAMDLPETAVRHIQARRLRSGDGLVLFDGTGGEYIATLVTLERRRAHARIDRFLDRDAESPVAVTLLQAISKGERMDYAVQKATELGVARIIPVITARCVVRIDRERWEKKQRHWQAVAVAASEQCGRNRIPPVATPCSLEPALAQVEDSSGVIFDTDGDHAASDLRPGDRLATLIGPEGGLTPDEIRRVADLGWQRLRLGPRILRSDTAPVAALAVIQTVIGDMG